MPHYRLSVIGTPDRGFLLSYNKRSSIRTEELREVIGFMSKLDISVLKAKPHYQNLNPSDEEIIEGARQAITRKSGLVTKTDNH